MAAEKLVILIIHFWAKALNRGLLEKIIAKYNFGLLPVTTWLPGKDSDLQPSINSLIFTKSHN